MAKGNLHSKYRILVINPGSTSTKIAIYDKKNEILKESISHPPELINQFKKVSDQYKMRHDLIMKHLEKAQIALESIDCIMARGGLLKPISGGVWKINKKMVSELKEAKRGEHASNLGAVIAHNLAEKHNIPCYIADPVVVDELDPVARITGMPEIKKISIFHALNQKYSAHMVATQLGKKYKDLNAIVAHMGGGITIGAHKNGKVIDVNNGLFGEGPFSPERTGSISAEQIVNLCFSGELTEQEIKKQIHGKGGLTAYFGTSDVKKIMENIDDEKTQLIINAMIYHICRYIGSLAIIYNGNIDAIVLTGGLAYNHYIVRSITERVNFLGPIFIFPGENEMESLKERAMEVYTGNAEVQEYV
jgi:butyrate kinase